MSPRKKIKVRAAVRVNAYEIVARAVEDSVAQGYRRAYKYTEDPTEEGMCLDIAQAVIGALCEVLDFGDPFTRVPETGEATMTKSLDGKTAGGECQPPSTEDIRIERDEARLLVQRLFLGGHLDTTRLDALHSSVKLALKRWGMWP